MRFGMVGRMALGMRPVIGFRVQSMGGSNLGANVGCHIGYNQWGVCSIVGPSQITLSFLVK